LINDYLKLELQNQQEAAKAMTQTMESFNKTVPYTEIRSLFKNRMMEAFKHIKDGF
jgi:hypothetical protein